MIDKRNAIFGLSAAAAAATLMGIGMSITSASAGTDTSERPETGTLVIGQSFGDDAITCTFHDVELPLVPGGAAGVGSPSGQLDETAVPFDPAAPSGMVWGSATPADGEIPEGAEAGVSVFSASAEMEEGAVAPGAPAAGSITIGPDGVTSSSGEVREGSDEECEQLRADIPALPGMEAPAED